MVWQAYIDESFDDGLFVLAGYIAPADQWAQFAVEWEQMLPRGYIEKNGNHHFKMSEMARSSERISRVVGFYRIIERYVSLGLSLTTRIADFEAGKKRLLVMNDRRQSVRVGGEVYDNLYLFAFTRLMNLFHEARTKADLQALIPLSDRVDFIFDHRAEKRAILGAWDEFLDGNPFRSQYGATPRFEADEKIVPLQAADFIAWWVRRWEGSPRDFDKSDPFPWKPHRSMHFVRANITADNVFDDLKAIVLKLGRGTRFVYDKDKLTQTTIDTTSNGLAASFQPVIPPTCYPAF